MSDPFGREQPARWRRIWLDVFAVTRITVGVVATWALARWLSWDLVVAFLAVILGPLLWIGQKLEPAPERPALRGRLNELASNRPLLLAGLVASLFTVLTVGALIVATGTDRVGPTLAAAFAVYAGTHVEVARRLGVEPAEEEPRAPLFTEPIPAEFRSRERQVERDRFLHPR